MNMKVVFDVFFWMSSKRKEKLFGSLKNTYQEYESEELRVGCFIFVFRIIQ